MNHGFCSAKKLLYVPLLKNAYNILCEFEFSNSLKTFTQRTFSFKINFKIGHGDIYPQKGKKNGRVDIVNNA